MPDKPQNQQLEFDQAAPDSSVTHQKAPYDDDIRELTEFWYLHETARSYGQHHQYRLHNFKGCLATLVTDYNLNRQHDVPKVCIQLHIDTPDTPNWYIKHHQGLEYLNMAMAQVTDNPAMADSSSIHQDAKQQLHEYIRTYIQPLMRAGKQVTVWDIIGHVTIRKPKLVQKIGTQQLINMVQDLLELT